MSYTDVEREVIGLCIVWDALNDLVNRAILDLRGVDADPRAAEVRFPTHVHRDLFLVRLLDFVNETGDATLTGVNGSCLAVLEHACKTRSFEIENSCALLDRTTNALSEWLQAATPLELWLPTLNVNAKLRVPRLEFLFIAANQAKHNISRLTAVSKRIATMLGQHGYTVPVEQVPLALDDFREHLHSDYFTYYGAWLAELLNKIRWGIYRYLRPTFEQSFTPGQDGGIAYSYRYPEAIVSDIPKEWFWRLMNLCRSEPWVHPFTVAEYMKRETLR
jgi:hypothetical protein